MENQRAALDQDTAVDATNGGAPVLNPGPTDAQNAHFQRMSAAAKEKSGQVAHTPQEAQRRLMRDLRSLQQSLASSAGATMGITAHPVDGNMFQWRAVISGPEATVWEGGLFKLELNFTAEYPIAPPIVKFLTPNMFHPNIYVDGNICLDTLKSCWSPSLDVEGLLLSIMSLLSDPNPRSAANGEAARMLTENKDLYETRVRQVVEQSLDQSFSEEDDDEE